MGEGLVLIGVGEVGHQIILKLALKARQLAKGFAWYVLIDPDIIEPHNPSFAGTSGYKAVVTASQLANALKYSVYHVLRFPQNPKPRTIYAVTIKAPAQMHPLFQRGVVIEATDSHEMLTLPTVHVHTGLKNERKAVWQIFYGPRNVPPQPHPPRGCVGLLGEAAEAVAEFFVRNCLPTLKEQGWVWGDMCFMGEVEG